MAGLGCGLDAGLTLDRLLFFAIYILYRLAVDSQSIAELRDADLNF
jgi:hypothetical protein